MKKFQLLTLTPEQDELLAATPTEELLKLPMLQTENVRDTLHAYQMAKRCNEKRVMAELSMSEKGAFITGSAFLIGGGATASYYYGLPDAVKAWSVMRFLDF